jgi:hypothetical protein
MSASAFDAMTSVFLYQRPYLRQARNLMNAWFSISFAMRKTSTTVVAIAWKMVRDGIHLIYRNQLALRSWVPRLTSTLVPLTVRGDFRLFRTSRLAARLIPRLV